MVKNPPTEVKGLFVVPADPAVPVRDPASREHLPVEGTWVGDSAYWRRRLRDGDVLAGVDADAVAELRRREAAGRAPAAPEPIPPADAGDRKSVV